MKRSLFVVLVFTLISDVGAFGCPLELASSDTRCGLSEVYDFALPEKVADGEAEGASEIVVLRYIPGDTTLETEYRIVLRSDASGRTHALRIEPDGVSILSQTRRLLQNGPMTCQAVKEQLRLESTEFTDQTVLSRILRNLHKLRPPAQLASEFYLDAPRYEVRIESGMNKVSWTLYGPDDSPLIAWFKQTSVKLTPAVVHSRQ